MSAPRWWALAVLAASLWMGCRRGAGRPPSPPSAVFAAESSAVQVVEGNQKPAVVSLIRDGDPRPGVGMAVAVEGGAPASAALSGLVDARLHAAGVTGYALEVDAIGYRFRATVEGPDDAAKLGAALRSALLAPVRAGTPEVEAAARRVQALYRHPLEAEALGPVAACSGALRPLPGRRAVDLTAPGGADQLETWRRASHVVERISFGLVSPPATAASLTAALRGGAPWPAAADSAAPGLGGMGSPPILPDSDAPSPRGASGDNAGLGGGGPDAEGSGGRGPGGRGSGAWGPGGGVSDVARAFVAPGRNIGKARLHLAIPLPDAPAAFFAFHQVLSPSGRLAARLAALPPGFRMVDRALSARPDGACALLVLELSRSAPVSETDLEVSSARAAALFVDALGAKLAEARSSDDHRPAAGTLGAERWRAARLASDPRDAAALLAWWNLSRADADRTSNREGTESLAQDRQLPNRPGRSLPLAAVLEIPAALANGAHRDGVAAFEAAASSRFAQALGSARRATDAQPFETRVRVERGQGELWVLAASPCGTADEGDEDWGGTALAIVAATAVEAGSHAAFADGVTVEPWITPDGVGFAAHAAPRPFETSHDLAVRVADALGRTLTAPQIDEDAFAQARGLLLDRLGQGPSAEGRALAAAAGALSPAHPARLAPIGSWDSLARGSRERATLRLGTLRASPLRIAVLANTDRDEADAAVRELASWLPREAGAAPACGPTGASLPVRPGRLDVALPARASGAQAIIALPMPAKGAPDRAAAEWTVAALDGASGWLTRALASAPPTTSATARLIGGGQTSALAIDLRAASPDLDDALAQVRGLLQRLAEGAISAADRERALATRSRRRTEQDFDPRRRLVELWRADAAPGDPPLVDAWRAFTARWLSEDRMVVVVARPPSDR